MDESAEIPFYDVIHRQQIRVPICQIHKSVFKQAARNGKVRVHYVLTAQLNGTILRKLVRRKGLAGAGRPVGLNPSK